MSLSLPPLSDLFPPYSGLEGGAGVDIVVSGEGRLILIVQCTRFVNNVNKRLWLLTGPGERRPLPTNARRVFCLLYL